MNLLTETLLTQRFGLLAVPRALPEQRWAQQSSVPGERRVSVGARGSSWPQGGPGGGTGGTGVSCLQPARRSRSSSHTLHHGPMPRHTPAGHQKPEPISWGTGPQAAVTKGKNWGHHRTFLFPSISSPPSLKK